MTVIYSVIYSDLREEPPPPNQRGWAGWLERRNQKGTKGSGEEPGEPSRRRGPGQAGPRRAVAAPRHNGWRPARPSPHGAGGAEASPARETPSGGSLLRQGGGLRGDAQAEAAPAPAAGLHHLRAQRRGAGPPSASDHGLRRERGAEAPSGSPAAAASSACVAASYPPSFVRRLRREPPGPRARPFARPPLQRPLQVRRRRRRRRGREEPAAAAAAGGEPGSPRGAGGGAAEEHAGAALLPPPPPLPLRPLPSPSLPGRGAVRTRGLRGGGCGGAAAAALCCRPPRFAPPAVGGGSAPALPLTSLSCRGPPAARRPR